MTRNMETRLAKLEAAADEKTAPVILWMPDGMTEAERAAWRAEQEAAHPAREIVVYRWAE